MPDTILNEDNTNISESNQSSATQSTVIHDQSVSIPKETFDSLMNLKQDVQDMKKEFITVFGIFASFVTFLSIEIQVFRTVDDFWLLLGLSSFLLASILLFAFTILNLAKSTLDWKMLRSPVPVFILIFLLISFIFFFISIPVKHHSNFDYKVFITP